MDGREPVLTRVLCSSACKWQQSNIPCLLDRQGQASLMRSAHARQATRYNPPAFRYELCEQTNVLVVDGLNLFHAEFADFFAPEILAPPTTATALATAAWTARTKRTALSIGPVTARG
jgi:hypothetical protein